MEIRMDRGCGHCYDVHKETLIVRIMRIGSTKVTQRICQKTPKDQV